ncbi:MAG: 2-oxoacid:acceptor oxidoreductase family protein [Candidatus Aureabacteria bacterium]|nr:2-oxoacid:acceptor oxidoreductase family protein [Candidatus Auribacterota bacterium]
MEKRIVISGFGGQGIIALGKFIALTAMNSDKHVTYLPSYGAEVRGGTANCQIIISDEEIASPCIEDMDILIAMNQPSLDRFCGKVVTGGLIVVNTSLAAAKSGAVNIPATEMAVSLGEKKIANVVALGALLAREEFLPVKDIKDALPVVLKGRCEKILRLNVQALDAGLRNSK